jgi:hypothetical protein
MTGRFLWNLTEYNVGLPEEKIDKNNAIGYNWLEKRQLNAAESLS